VTHPSFERLRGDLRRALEATADLIADLPEQRFTAESADGHVRAIVTGTQQLLELTFSPRAKRAADNHTLGDDVVEAVRAAEHAAANARAQVLDALTLDGRSIRELAEDPGSALPHSDVGRRHA
jgi:DNA-binding protein YbaB